MRFSEEPTRVRVQGVPLRRQRKRDCEGLPPFTWGLGLCPNFLLSCVPP